MGIFQWKRVPMGIKGASAYFQKMITIVVLAGLMYKCIESYLDDVGAWGSFLISNRDVLQRFREHGVYAHAHKCRFGFGEVEFVGHQVDETGLTFSREK
jgi:hypothetical protein